MIRYDDLIADMPAGLDLNDPEQQHSVELVANKLLERTESLTELNELELTWCKDREATPLSAHLAIKLARSRRMLQELEGPIHASVVFAVYKEHTRILKASEHPHGEDFLRRKVQQLDWLVAGTKATWDLTVVDDGCPENSGRLAETIIESDGLGDRVQVLFLQDAIDKKLPIVLPLTTPDDSRKGGSVVLGMWKASRIDRDGHVIIFTDADLSTHLGETGLLLDPILRGGADAAIGSRREPTSVIVKAGTRNTRGKLFIYLWKRLFPELGDLVDTQCGFKAFSTATVSAITEDMIEKKFAFDIELLLKTELRRAGAITKVGVAWIDSEAASTTTDIQPYLPMLQTMAKMVAAYVPSRPDGDAFANFLGELDDEGWNRLVDNVPEEIASREPHEFGSWSGVTVEELQVIVGG
jgi:hypothetical protein